MRLVPWPLLVFCLGRDIYRCQHTNTASKNPNVKNSLLKHDAYVITVLLLFLKRTVDFLLVLTSADSNEKNFKFQAKGLS